jgi:tetratricopeptide (TPR) repeat protein
MPAIRRRPLALATASVLLALATAATAAAQPRTGGGCDPAVRTRAALERETVRLQGIATPSPMERCRLAMLVLRGGNVARADTLLQQLVREAPREVPALLALAQLQRQAYRFADAERSLQAATALAPRHAAVRLQRADVALGASDLDAAEALYRDVRRDDPASAGATLGIARVHHLRERPDSALAELEALLARDSLNASALLLQARVFREQQQTQRWKDATHRALAVDSLSADAHSALATILRDAGGTGPAYRSALAALALDPYEEGARGYIANGGSITSHGRHPPLADDSVPASLAARLDSAARALDARRFDAADTAYRAILAERPGLTAAVLGVGAAHYRRGQYREALDWYIRAAEQLPDLGIAHYRATQAMKSLRDARNPRLQAAAARFRAAAPPPEPERLRELFPDFDRVDADLQRVILVSVAPVSRYIPLLATAGATFEIIPFERRMWEVPGRERTRGTRTFDLRLWDDVKGQGGFRALAGEEWVRDAVYGRYNVLAHEFLHQVHGTVLTDAQREEVQRLFARATRERRTLDYYADFNEMEYLAQAYEAWLSETKPPDQKGTSGNTRARLAALDPDVLRFLEQLNASSSRDNEIVAHRQKVQSLVGDGKLAEALAAATSALSTYGDHADLLALRGSILAYQGDHAAAAEAHRLAIARFPDQIRGYVGLADDHVLGRREHAQAVEALAAFTARQPRSAEGWMRLAELQLAAGQLDGAGASVARAESLAVAPNPYAGYATPTVVAARRAMLAGDHASAERLYRQNLERVDRNDVGAWVDLAAIAIERGDRAAAGVALATAQSIDRRDARVRELDARLRALDGRPAEAREIVLALLAEDTTRIESLTAVVARLREDDPARAAGYAAQGLRLIDERRPVRFTYERGRFRARGTMTVPAIARFHTEAALLAERQGDTAAAIRRHEAAVTAFRHAHPSLLALVRLHARAGDRAAAERWARALEASGAPARVVDEARALLGAPSGRAGAGGRPA